MLDHEKAVLGACLVNSANIGPVVESLRSDHFTAKARPIFLAMKAMLEIGQPVELIGLKNQLVKTASLESVGGHCGGRWPHGWTARDPPGSPRRVGGGRERGRQAAPGGVRDRPPGHRGLR